MPKSVAKMLGATNAVMGFVVGCFLLILALFSQAQETNVMPIVFGIGAPIVMPIFYGVMGYVMGFVMAWVYNFVAKRVGGIEIETE